MKEMFWGLALENGKRYAKTVETPFRITQAVLDTTTADNDIVRVMVDVDDCETLLCNLSLKHGILQCPLDLQFLDGEQIALYAYGGKGQVYLSGYLISEEGEESMFGDEEEDVAEEEEVSSDEDVPELVAPSTSGKRKPDSIANPIPVKKSKVQEVEAVQPTKVTVCEMAENGVKGPEEDDEDEDDEDYDAEEEEGSDEEGEEEESDDDEMEDEEVEEEDDGDEEMEGDADETPKAEIKTPKAEVKAEAKTPKAEAKTPKAEAKTPKAEAKTPKAEAKTPKAEAKTPKAEVKSEIEEMKDDLKTNTEPDTEMAGSELDNSLSETKTPSKKEKKKKKKELLAMNGEAPQTPKQKTEETQKQDDAPKTPKQKQDDAPKTPKQKQDDALKTPKQNKTPAVPVVALLGDSWMTRLSEDCLPQYQIWKFSKGGANAAWFSDPDKPQFTNFVTEVIELRPDVAVIHMGGNDIKLDCNVEAIVEAIATVYEQVHDCGIAAFISEIPIRTKCSRSNLSSEEYDKLRMLINQKLYDKLATEDCNPIFDFPLLDESCLKEDGVHLSQNGYAVYVVRLVKLIDSFLKKEKRRRKDLEKGKICDESKLEKTPKSQLKEETAAVASPVVSKAGGVICEDLVVGTGQEAKNGRMVSVYYEGRLKSNNKMFDSTLKGPPFKFRLGGGEVIKGWDVGVNGMKVGGKRRVVCPPHMAYGKRGAAPDIPKNATLTFTIELKGV